MKIKEWLNKASKLLEDRLEREILLAHILQVERPWLISHDMDEVSSQHARSYSKALSRRKSHTPIAQIVGYKEFYGRRFNVNKHVLIPRPETELFIESIVENEAGHIDTAQNHAPIIWDIGTGSGAIAVTLACELPNAKILATDISQRALETAQENAKMHDFVSRIHFLQSDLIQKPVYRFLQQRGANNSHVILCANLPYLPISDIKKLSPDIRNFEPHTALFSGTDGNDLIIKFLHQLSRHLPEFGFIKTDIYIECDPPQSHFLQQQVKKLFPSARIEIKNDLATLPRLLCIYLSSH